MARRTQRNKIIGISLIFVVYIRPMKKLLSYIFICYSAMKTFCRMALNFSYPTMKVVIANKISLPTYTINTRQMIKFFVFIPWHSAFHLFLNLIRPFKPLFKFCFKRFMSTFTSLTQVFTPSFIKSNSFIRPTNRGKMFPITFIGAKISIIPSIIVNKKFFITNLT